MKIFKKPFFWVITSYVAFMLYKTPEISDSLIIIALCAILGFTEYLEFRSSMLPSNNTDLDKLREELDKERLKVLINQTKHEAVRQNAMLDDKNSGGLGEKRFVF